MLVFSRRLFCFFMVLFGVLTSCWVHGSDENILASLISSGKECLLSQALQVDMKHVSLYTKVLDRCEVARVDKSGKQVVYGTEDCGGAEIDFKRTRYRDVCADLAAPNKDRLGNAAVWAGETQAWTLNPAGRLNIGVLPITNNYHPYMKRVRYKSVTVRDHYKIDEGVSPSAQVVALRGVGRCDLEMRIFKKDPFQKGLKPLLAIHGGAWKYRGAPYLGFESQLSHFTEQGFVVFAPFYRLSSYSDGNYECNHAHWREIVSDAEDALEWVKKHAPEYGAIGNKIYLMGGSAGAHLAGWLTVHKKENIERALLFYPATDFRAYFQQALASDEPLKGEGILKTFLGIGRLEDVDLLSDPINLNTFTDYVSQSPDQYPPVALVHGINDILVPSTQSVRLCNAYNGDVENGPAENNGGNPDEGVFSKTYSCGEEGKMYLVAQGEHALDSCVEELACPAGGEASRDAVAQIMQATLQWLNKQ